MKIDCKCEDAIARPSGDCNVHGKDGILEKEVEYQRILDCRYSGQISEADIHERLRDDAQFAQFVFKHIDKDKDYLYRRK